MSLKDVLKLQQQINSTKLSKSVSDLLTTQQTFVKLNKYLATVSGRPAEEHWLTPKPGSLVKYLTAFHKMNSYLSHLHISPVARISTSSVAPINTSPLSPEFALLNIMFRKFDIPSFEEPRISGIEEDRMRGGYSAGETQIPKIITDIYNDHSIFNKVESRQFEEIMAELLRSQGYKVELTKQTKDGGYDILALASLKGNIPVKVLVECKRYKNKVGVGIIRSFKEVVMSNDANMGIIATTGLFTTGAWRKKEQTPYLLDFRDKDAIISWVEDYMTTRNKTTNITYLS